MKLHEVLSTPVRWEWSQKSDDQWIAKFLVNQHQYTVRFMPEEIPAPNEDDEPGLTTEVDFAVGTGNDIDFGVTGTGGAFQVFSTVHDIINDFVLREKPQSLMFSAKEQSREKLYRRCVGRLSKLGWKIEELNHTPDATWVLSK